ncbi:CBS domain-containing protein [Deinococcus hohokamensis]|uniref:CBS domain-containing protein n=1 Tax=Deinococcus hohokamensis TaxID=309883 RepID=A0ABV9I8W1_9DEIO
MTTLKDIMTRDLTTVTPQTTLREVAGLMRDQDIGNVLVMDGERLSGIITDRDIVVRAVAGGEDLNAAVSGYASGDVFTMDCASDLREAARAMAERQLRRLPVTEGGQVVGIISLGDLAVRAESNADQQALEGISQPG